MKVLLEPQTVKRLAVEAVERIDANRAVLRAAFVESLFHEMNSGFLHTVAVGLGLAKDSTPVELVTWLSQIEPGAISLYELYPPFVASRWVASAHAWWIQRRELHLLIRSAEEVERQTNTYSSGFATGVPYEVSLVEVDSKDMDLLTYHYGVAPSGPGTTEIPKEGDSKGSNLP